MVIIIKNPNPIQIEFFPETELLRWLNTLNLSSEGCNGSVLSMEDLPQLTELDIKIILAGGSEITGEVIKRLFQVIEKQQAENEALRKKIKELEDRLNVNSKNSHNPPSSDRFAKPKNNRKKSGKPLGGQEGHQGHTLNQAEHPDKIVRHQVKNCKDCGSSLESLEPDDLEKHQVFDLPPVKIEITEHQVEHKVCPHCGCENEAEFPEGAEQPAQYGQELKALVVYLRQYQLLPYERIRELFEDLFGHSISTGTLVNINSNCYDLLQPVEEELKSQITNSPVVHFDETGISIEGKGKWLHVASTSHLTYFFPHTNRGQKATTAIDILPHFEGTAVHDHWQTYFMYDCEHGLCNSHHLRELSSCEERDEQQWATDMKALLIEIKDAVDERRLVADHLTLEEIQEFQQRYRSLVEEGLALNPPIEQEPGKRGRKKQTKTKNLLDRFDERERYVLTFMRDFNVPFENNQALC